MMPRLSMEPFGVGMLCCCLLPSGPVAATQVASFQAGNGGWQLGTLAIGRLNGARGLQLVVPYRDASGTWYLDAFTYTGERLPGFPFRGGGEPINVSPTLYDLDHDGRDEILFTCGTRVVALRGNGSVLWSSSVDASNYVPNGGYQTVTNGFYWYPTGEWLPRLPSSAQFYSEVSPPMVADLNGTGNLQVITGWKILPDPLNGGQDYNPFIFPVYGVGPWGAMGETWSGGVVFFDALSGRRDFVYHLHHLVESGLAIGRPEPNSPLNVYVLNDNDGVVCFDKSQPFGLWGKGMLHKQFGKNQRVMTGSYTVPIDIYTADVDGDGLDEVLVAGTQLSSQWQPNETILDDDGSILWRRWLPQVQFANAWGWLNSASLIPINPDHDNHLDVLAWNDGYELTYRYWNGVELVDHDGWPKNFYPFLPTLPVVGDVDGDGQEEIVLGTYNPSANPSAGDLRVYALDGTLKLALPVPGGIKQVPALADVEGVGRLDVVYRALDGEVYIQNLGSTSTNRVSWATHRGNMRRDGNHGASLYPPGTPLVQHKASGFNRASFSWTNAVPAQFYRVYRAEQPEGPFRHIATVPGNLSAFTDYHLQPGRQYLYEVGAVYGTNTVHSVPFAILSLLNSNLLANAGFEENENSHWDKWFTGSIEMTNMCASTNVVLHGQRSMRIVLQNQGDNSSIAQFNQYGIPDATLYVTPEAFYSFGGYFKSTGISQPSEHWLEWSSTKTGLDTNDRPALPYPLYFTPHVVADTNASEWIYVNRTFQMPAGFPNVELRHRYTIAAPGSGSIYLDDVFFRQIPAPTASVWQSLISFGSDWRYSTATPAPNWLAADFNDTAWPLGKAKLGAGSGPTNITTRLPQYLPAYYFRTRFQVTSTNVEELLLAATCTDASNGTSHPLRLFLNGTEVPSPIDTVTLQGNEVRYFDLTPFAPLLIAGTNTLAAQLANAWSDYDDVAFDLSLRAVACPTPNNPSVSVEFPFPNAPSLCCSAPAGTVWQVQSCEALGQDCWQMVQVFTNTGSGIQCFQDAGQQSHPPPAGVGSRFYRLAPF